MNERNGFGEFIGSALADIVGLAFCMAMLSGAYFIGYSVAPYFGGIDHRDTFGLLAAMNLIWVYEHQKAHHRWGKLLSRD
jgi:hypothetical protein